MTGNNPNVTCNKFNRQVVSARVNNLTMLTQT